MAAIAAAVVVATGVPIGVDASGPGLKVLSTPNPTGSNFTLLQAVSCSSSGVCTAVGSGSESGDGATLAERESAGTWTVQTTPNPAGASGSHLNGVSCPSATVCVAVGYASVYQTQPYSRPLAERWNGSTWSIQDVPSPSGSRNTVLYAVSCASAAACIAVGYSEDNTTLEDSAIAVAWNGSAWSLLTTASGFSESEFRGVSCTTATTCTAVGRYYDSGGTGLTLIEAWNGSTWSVQPSPNSNGAFDNELFGISCVLTRCAAVGYSSFSNQDDALTEVWDGTAWTQTPSAIPSSASGSTLWGVACISPFACNAVGTYTLSDGNQYTLVNHWNGAEWVILPSPQPHNASLSSLTSVWCASATSCVAAGWKKVSSYTTLVVGGSFWVAEATPSPTGITTSDFLYGVSCTAAKSCIAVGTANGLTLAERWNGVTWSAVSTPTGAQYSSLQGVSCLAAGECTAVGSQTNSSGVQLTLAETWNGTKWTRRTTPNPTGAHGSFLNAVSCPTSSSCMAAGAYVNSGGTQVAMAEAWDGQTWTLQTVPEPSGATRAALNGISCPPGTDCIAVGYYVDSGGTQHSLAEQWSGTNWTIQATSDPSGATLVGLNGISCVSTTACVAVGEFLVAGNSVTLTEAWDGSTWTIGSVPTPADATGAALLSVSCTTASTCTAGGYASAGNLVSMVAHRSAAAWSLQPVPEVPEAAGGSSLYGVSCSTTTACTAVGYYDDGAGDDLTLALR